MRILLVGAGASFSTFDVEMGYFDAFKARPDVEVFSYALDARIGLSQRWMNLLWRARGKQADDRPGWPDVIYHAGVGALERALAFDVDWVIAVSAMYLHPIVLELMERAGIRTSIIFTESPYADAEQSRVASLVDMCWTNERTSVPYLQRFNQRTRYLRAAYDPVRHTPVATVDPDVPRHDVVFVGSGFQERIDLLSAVDWTGIDLGLYGMWSLLPSRHKLRQYLKGGITDNVSATALYRAAKIGLNLHRTSQDYSTTPTHIERAESMNPRAYELAACGVFQYGDFRKELLEIFDGWVVASSVPSNMETDIRQFLKEPDTRTALAFGARQRIEPHTFAARAAQVLADLEAIEQPIAKGA